MSVYGWVFKLYVRFCVWQLSGKNILLFTFDRSVNKAQFFSAKYMFAMVPTKEYSIQNSAFCLSQKPKKQSVV